jgi:transcriptional regulator with XRE-family HTH domain
MTALGVSAFNHHNHFMSVLLSSRPLSEHLRPRDIESPGQRLQKLRKLRNLTQEALAERVGVQRLAISRWETGDRGFGRAARKLAAALQTDPQWLEYGGAGGPATLPVVGYVGAGSEVYPFNDGETFDEIEAPFGAPPDARVLISKGDSMMPEIGDGDYIVYREITQRVDDLLGKRCVVRLDDGRVLVKRLRRGTTYGTYTLDSTNAAPIEDVVIVRAAKLESVVFR